MRYTLFSLNDERSETKAQLIRGLHRIRWKQVFNENVNGSIPHELERQIEKWGFKINYLPIEGQPKKGHIGIWFTVLNSLHNAKNAPFVTFEDDAVLGTNFQLNWQFRMRELPRDTDFFSLFIPRDHDHVYSEDMSVSRHLTRTYQRYGGVSMMYTPQGAEKILELLERDGITGQYDNSLYRYAARGELNGYCSKPTVSDLVYIRGTEPSQVQETDFYAG